MMAVSRSISRVLASVLKASMPKTAISSTTTTPINSVASATATAITMRQASARSLF